MTIRLEEIHRAKYVGRSVELPARSCIQCVVKLSVPSAFGVFTVARLHRRDRYLTQFPAPFPFLENRQWG